MPNPALSTLFPVSQFLIGWDSSTEFRPRQDSPWAALAQAARKHVPGIGEVALLTMASRETETSGDGAPSHAWMTERNESVSARIIPIRNPNGKDKPKTGPGLLLKDPNTSEINPSADSWCQQSASADGQVMDRGAERAAGGYDAI